MSLTARTSQWCSASRFSLAQHLAGPHTCTNMVLRVVSIVQIERAHTRLNIKIITYNYSLHPNTPLVLYHDFKQPSLSIYKIM